MRDSTERLLPLADCLPKHESLPGWQLRVFDGNHLPACEKRLEPRRDLRGAARSYTQVWIGDRHFCTHAILEGLAAREAAFIVREHAHHPRLQSSGPWSAKADTETGQVREQAIELAQPNEGATQSWLRIEIVLDTPTTDGERSIVLWSNLPPEIDVTTIAQLYRQRWRIEGMFQRLEPVLNGEIKSLGRPSAALLGFTLAVLTYNVLSLLERFIEHAHHAT